MIQGECLVMQTQVHEKPAWRITVLFQGHIEVIVREGIMNVKLHVYVPLPRWEKKIKTSKYSIQYLFICWASVASKSFDHFHSYTSDN